MCGLLEHCFLVDIMHLCWHAAKQTFLGCFTNWKHHIRQWAGTISSQEICEPRKFAWAGLFVFGFKWYEYVNLLWVRRPTSEAQILKYHVICKVFKASKVLDVVFHWEDFFPAQCCCNLPTAFHNFVCDKCFVTWVWVILAVLVQIKPCSTYLQL